MRADTHLKQDLQGYRQRSKHVHDPGVMPDIITHVCCMTCHHKLSLVCSQLHLYEPWCTYHSLQDVRYRLLEAKHMSTRGSLSGSPLGQSTLDLG